MKPDFSKMTWRCLPLWSLLICFALLAVGLIASGLCLYLAHLVLTLAMMRHDWLNDVRLDDRAEQCSALLHATDYERLTTD